MALTKKSKPAKKTGGGSKDKHDFHSFHKSIEDNLKAISEGMAATNSLKKPKSEKKKSKPVMKVDPKPKKKIALPTFGKKDKEKKKVEPKPAVEKEEQKNKMNLDIFNKIIKKDKDEKAPKMTQEPEDKDEKTKMVSFKDEKKNSQESQEKQEPIVKQHIQNIKDMSRSGNILSKYDLLSDGVEAQVIIKKDAHDYVPYYFLNKPELQEATLTVLNSVREKVISIVELTEKEFVDPKAMLEVKEKFMKTTDDILKLDLPMITDEERKILVGELIHTMLGLGDIEVLLADAFIEEIVINNSDEPIWVFHKKHGWVKTSIKFDTEEAIYNLSSSIGRKIGRQITNLNPLMDAHLSSGDRVNSTLFPISSHGNTLTIRRFSRDPWTIIKLIDPDSQTMSVEMAAFLWLCMQYELNILVVGGTASGKTSLLNSVIPFVPPNQRIVSIEDTREIQLPGFMHWVPMSSRLPNPEGKGGVKMIDLLANSLRMRPDRIIVGEIRREKEAEVMFEAIRTGHSAYATFHADSAEQAHTRLTNAPINLKESQISALHIIVVQYRHRRLGVRRTSELAELIPMESMGKSKVNVVYKWNARDDTFNKIGRIVRVAKELSHFAGMNDTEIEKDIKEKEIILKWMVKHKIQNVDLVGRIFAEYYLDPKKILQLARNGDYPKELLK